MSNPNEDRGSYGECRTIGNSSNIAWHHGSVTKQDIHTKRNHKSCIIWFTGLSGSGKSSLANALHTELFERNISSYVLDGDNIRHGLNSDLSFSDTDRTENIRRIGHVAALFVDAGMIVLTAFVSPFRSDRIGVRDLVNREEFIEVFCNSSIEKCEERDTKGLYSKARSGVIPNFTGISSPYEQPESPELNIDTQTQNIADCVKKIIRYLEDKSMISNTA